MKKLIKLARIKWNFHIRYLTFLFFFILLYREGEVELSSFILFVSPFLFSIPVGFIYNNICDAKIDLVSKNPLVNGSITPTAAWLTFFILQPISFMLFFAFFKQPLSYLFFFLFSFLWLAYSGLNIRFKESLAGPFIAAFIEFIGQPLVLLSEFKAFSIVNIILLLGFYLWYVATEIRHTLKDYKQDKEKGVKTFSVIFGEKNSKKLILLLLILGSFLVTSEFIYIFYLIDWKFAFIWSFIFLLGFILILVHWKHSFNIFKNIQQLFFFFEKKTKERGQPHGEKFDVYSNFFMLIFIDIFFILTSFFLLQWDFFLSLTFLIIMLTPFFLEYR